MNAFTNLTQFSPLFSEKTGSLETPKEEFENSERKLKNLGKEIKINSWFGEFRKCH